MYVSKKLRRIIRQSFVEIHEAKKKHKKKSLSQKRMTCNPGRLHGNSFPRNVQTVTVQLYYCNRLQCPVAAKLPKSDKEVTTSLFKEAEGKAMREFCPRKQGGSRGKILGKGRQMRVREGWKKGARKRETRAKEGCGKRENGWVKRR